MSEKHRQILLILFYGSVVASIFQLAANPRPPAGGEMVALARSLADSGAYTDPFFVARTGPTAVAPPFYPAFLSLLLKIFGESQFPVAASIATVLVHAVHATLLPLVSLALLGRMAPGICAAAVTIIFPVFRILPAWDAVYSACGLMLFVLVSHKGVSIVPFRIGPGVISGVIGGALALANPSTLIVVGLWVFYLVLRRGANPSRPLRFCCTALGVLVITVAPWVLRNRAVLGSVVLKDNLGMTLYASNNDCAHSAMDWNLISGCYVSHHPNTSVAEATLLRAMGELEYDKFRTRSAIEWIKRNPIPFVRLTGARIREFWFPNSAVAKPSMYSVWLVTALSIPGLVLFVARRERPAGFMLAAMAIYPLMYYVVVSDARYRYPILWLSLLAAGRAVEFAVGWARSHRLARGLPRHLEDLREPG